MAMCPLTIHALLHIADSIENAGPVWTYWAFPMERFCGRLKQAVSSRRFPWSRIDNHVTSIAHLDAIRMCYNLEDTVSLTRKKQPSGSVLSFPETSDCEY
jgi:hypothetical protein